VIVGGGMITHDQLLPAAYHLQRQGRVGEISVCAQRPRTVQRLAASPALSEAFPGHSFHPYPAEGDPDVPQPEMFRELIGRMAPGGIVMVAVPDQLHREVILCALQHGQHVCVVKPLVLKQCEAMEIAHEAYERGLVLGEEARYRKKDILYLEMPDGNHDVQTWKQAMPEFLKWSWGISK